MRLLDEFKQKTGIPAMTAAKRLKREIRVGAVILLALAVMITVVFLIGGQSRMFGGKARYRILFESTSGLYTGDPVLLEGVEVGNVTGLGFSRAIEEKKILVTISVEKNVAPRIRKDTRARIASASLVYGKVVDLTMGSALLPAIPEGGFIESDKQTPLESIVDSTGLIAGDIRRMFSKINRGEGTIGMLFNESLEMRQTLSHLALSSARLAAILDRLDRGQGTLGALLSDSVEFRRSIVDVKTSLSNLEKWTGRLDDNRSVIGKLVNDTTWGESVMKDISSAARSLSSITAKIDTGRGTLGRLINDQELYTGLEDVVLGMRKSSVSKWLIQNRRKAGEKERNKQEQPPIDTYPM
jgi:phospholipid/cholesterol/gamma-HCH transport system substrate-binding protein